MQNGKQNTHKCTQIIKDTEKNVQNGFKEEQYNHKTRGKNTTKRNKISKKVRTDTQTTTR